VYRLALSLVVFAAAAAGVFCGEAAALNRVQVPGAQVALNRHGFYKGPIDGVAGPMTRRAIRDFQRAKGLEPDGIVGRRTRAAFGRRFGGPLFGTRLLERGTAGFDVSVLQFLLAQRGFSPGSPDATFGPITEGLVQQFQRRMGLSPDGIVGRQTRAALVTGRPWQAVVISQVAADAPTASRAAIEASLQRWAAYYGISLDLVRALAWQESGFQNDVRSSAGAVGPLQVIPATRAFVERFLIGQTVPRTMDGNVRLGVAYLHHLLHRFGMDARLALGAYYSGPAAVLRRGLSRETRHFVDNVLALRGRV
jgi:peptidoglycan hydrolase-like protein with peptidoglycan-binding domain